MIVKILHSDGRKSFLDKVKFIKNYVGIGGDNGVVYYLDSFIDDIIIEFEEDDYEKTYVKEKGQKSFQKHGRQKQKN